MSSLIANTFNFVDFAESSIDDNDLEVEEILNEIGFFSSDDCRYVPSFGGESSLPFSFEAFAPAQFAPVSPEHHTSEVMLLPISRVSPSVSIEATTTFSVPNPIAVISLDPSFFAPTATVQNDASADLSPKSPKRITRADPAKGRKRKLADKSLAPKVPSSMARAIREKDEAELTEDQLEERRQRNREHAKRSRQRKKSLTCTLQQSLDDLKEENTKLRQQIIEMVGSDKVDSILENRRKREQGQFMAGLMQPSSRILDDGTISFLKGLQKGLPSDVLSSKRQKTN